METIKEIEKVMNQAGISLPHFREYCINWITDSPNLDPVLIIEDVMKLESSHLKAIAKKNGGRPHLEIINGGKVHSSGEEYIPDFSEDGPKSMTDVDVKKEAVKFVEAVTETT